MNSSKTSLHNTWIAIASFLQLNCCVGAKDNRPGETSPRKVTTVSDLSATFTFDGGDRNSESQGGLALTDRSRGDALILSSALQNVVSFSANEDTSSSPAARSELPPAQLIANAISTEDPSPPANQSVLPQEPISSTISSMVNRFLPAAAIEVQGDLVRSNANAPAPLYDAVAPEWRVSSPSSHPRTHLSQNSDLDSKRKPFSPKPILRSRSEARLQSPSRASDQSPPRAALSIGSSSRTFPYSRLAQLRTVESNIDFPSAEERVRSAKSASAMAVERKKSQLASTVVRTQQSRKTISGRERSIERGDNEGRDNGR